MKTAIAIHACLAIASCPLLLATAADIPEPPGKIDVCWIGNTFSGNHDEEGNGYGLWVQNAADEIEVTADGLVAAGCGWDEAGRCAGLYRDGKVNRDLLKNRSQPESAWGFDTGNGALAFDGNSLYVVNHGGRLLRFSGDTKDLESWRFVESCELGIVPIAANAFDGVLAIATTNHVELRKCDAPAVPITTWDLPAATAGEATPEIKDLAFDAQGRLWVIVGDGIRLFQTADGKLEEIPCGSFKSLAKPEAIARDASNPRLMIVCDNGPDKQVKFYDVSKPKSPKLKKTFGDKGGIFSNVTRVIYTAEDDSLYLTGYLKTDEYDSWGLCGKTLRRYNGWTSGNPTIAWTIALPVDPHGLDGDRAFSCKGFATAGDYLFVSSAKAIDGLHRTFVLDKKDGRVLGAFKPRDAVSTNVGWHDMPYSVTAFRRSNGEYMVIIEEDARAKNILYRWTPPPQD